MTSCAPDLGRAGEQAVARHLESLGYRVLSRRFRARRGELDLVCQRDGKLVVIEVKTRLGENDESPAEAVGARKRRALAAAWSEYRRLSGWRGPVEFVVASVTAMAGELQIELLEEVF